MTCQAGSKIRISEETIELMEKINRFQEIIEAQPLIWRKKLNNMYINEPDVAIAAWTLIASMENLMLEIEETDEYLKKVKVKP